MFAASRAKNWRRGVVQSVFFALHGSHSPRRVRSLILRSIQLPGSSFTRQSLALPASRAVAALFALLAHGAIKLTDLDALRNWVPIFRGIAR